MKKLNLNTGEVKINEISQEGRQNTNQQVQENLKQRLPLCLDKSEGLVGIHKAKLPSYLPWLCILTSPKPGFDPQTLLVELRH